MNISSSGKPDQIRKFNNHILLHCSCNHVLKIAVGGIGLGPNPGSDSARATRTEYAVVAVCTYDIQVRPATW